MDVDATCEKVVRDLAAPLGAIAANCPPLRRGGRWQRAGHRAANASLVGGVQPPKNDVCTHCGQCFASRGQLFKHLRHEPGVAPCVAGIGAAPSLLQPQRLAVLVGYCGAPSAFVGHFAQAIAAAAVAESAPKEIKALQSPISAVVSVATLEVELPPSCVGRTKSLNVSVLDHVLPAALCSWGNEDLGTCLSVMHGAGGGVSAPNAVGDVLSLTVPMAATMSMDCFVTELNARLPRGALAFAAAVTPPEFNAERDATHRRHQYILPIRVLVPPTEEVPGLRPRDAGKLQDLLKLFKSVLRRFVGERLWHNFLGCRAQPHNSRRNLNTCGGYGMVCLQGELFICVSLLGGLRGEQVCRVVTLVVAVMRGLLPEDVIDFCLSDACVLDITPAPLDACILAELHYGTSETRHRMVLRPRPEDSRAKASGGGARRKPSEASSEMARGKGFDHHLGLFEACKYWRFRVLAQLAAIEIRDRTLSRWAEDGELSRWATGALERARSLRSLEARVLVPPPIWSPPPPLYARVLSLLRQVDSDGSWPITSTGRRALIRDSQNGCIGGGSFAAGSMPGQCTDPIANTTHAELVDAIFELERMIAPLRPGSSTVAVNRRAAFTPHKDSGAGAGQSLSLIVALGDFTGGELLVEGSVHDVRYAPLEFDGWAQRHWTAPFAGERFSLVWFTPCGCENKGWLDEQARRGGKASVENRLACSHCPGPLSLPWWSEYRCVSPVL